MTPAARTGEGSRCAISRPRSWLENRTPATPTCKGRAEDQERRLRALDAAVAFTPTALDAGGGVCDRDGFVCTWCGATVARQPDGSFLRVSDGASPRLHMRDGRAEASERAP
jgi:hypothetical protein